MNPTTTDHTELRTAVKGTVLTSGDEGYSDARRLHNGAIDRTPQALVQVTGPTDVAAALEFARRRGLEVSVRGGGHGVAGHALGGDVVIDLSALRGVTVNPVSRMAVVRAGSTWGEVDPATQAYALALPGGRITHTGVAGLTLGGGEGWLSPKHGLTCDNLLSAEVVTADGRVVTASEQSTPELFWALRGGGGNFGVVTSFTFRLHPLAPPVHGGLLMYRLSDAAQVLGIIEELEAMGNDEFAAAAVFLSAPPAPFVPGDLVGKPVLGVVPAWLGDPAAGARVLRPLYERVKPLVDNSGPMPYVVLQSLLDASSPTGLRQRWSAAFLPTLSAGLVSDLEDAASAFPGPHSHIIVSQVGGAVSRVPVDATAYPHRDESWLVHPVAQWSDAADDAAHEGWVRDVATKIRSYGETSTYLNVDEGDDARVKWAFGEEKYRRLQAVKSAWDPDDVFRHCNHIEPATPRG